VVDKANAMIVTRSKDRADMVVESRATWFYLRYSLLLLLLFGSHLYSVIYLWVVERKLLSYFMIL
jgi:hypothetical protein